MMRYQTALSGALATLLVVPAVTLGEGQLSSLEDTLSGTLRSLRVMAGIQVQVENGDEGAARSLLKVTETPILDPKSRDDRVVTLRDEVNLLRTELDALENQAVASPGLQATSSAAPGLGRVGTGLDDDDRIALENISRPGGNLSGLTTGFTTQGTPPPPGAVSPEHDGYSADALRHARACFRAGRHREALAVLGNSGGAPEILYWRARCLEELDRLTESASLLEQVVASDATGSLGRRARTDLDFVRWKIEFYASLPAGLRASMKENG